MSYATKFAQGIYVFGEHFAGGVWVWGSSEPPSCRSCEGYAPRLSSCWPTMNSNRLVEQLGASPEFYLLAAKAYELQWRAHLKGQSTHFS